MENCYNGRYKEFINKMSEGDARTYIISRVVPQMDYYSKSSTQNQKRFHLFSVLSIILNGIIPVLVLFGEIDFLSYWMKILTASASGAAGIISAVSALMNFKELWIQYRVNLELLKGVLDRFFLSTGEFYEIRNDEEKKLNLLENTCREIMSREHDLWKQLQSEKRLSNSVSS